MTIAMLVMVLLMEMMIKNDIDSSDLGFYDLYNIVQLEWVAAVC